MPQKSSLNKKTVSSFKAPSLKELKAQNPSINPMNSSRIRNNQINCIISDLLLKPIGIK